MTCKLIHDITAHSTIQHVAASGSLRHGMGGSVDGGMGMGGSVDCGMGMGGSVDCGMHTRL